MGGRSHNPEAGVTRAEDLEHEFGQLAWWGRRPTWNEGRIKTDDGYSAMGRRKVHLESEQEEAKAALVWLSSMRLSCSQTKTTIGDLFNPQIPLSLSHPSPESNKMI